MDIYVVQPGDTINSIADQFGVTATQLIQDNRRLRGLECYGIPTAIMDNNDRQI